MRKFVLLIPLIYLMPHLVPDPTLGVYLAEPVADTLAVTFTSIRFSPQFRSARRPRAPARGPRAQTSGPRASASGSRAQTSGPRASACEARAQTRQALFRRR